MIKLTCLLIISTILIIGCTLTLNRSDLAHKTLNEFFDYLNLGNYRQAADRYRGNYETLLQMNPGIDQEDHATLWKNACQNNGFHCLRIKSDEIIKIEGNMITFQVVFLNQDGSVFYQRPCCGEDQSPTNLKSSFIYRVYASITGQAGVMDLPVYTP
jgi:hypothetical protein